jgi:hypothetical protein
LAQATKRRLAFSEMYRRCVPEPFVRRSGVQIGLPIRKRVACSERDFFKGYRIRT